ncbi:hypothetical protein ACF09J_22470 [Streptomyces sp. NPDC014889]|uniref:hypothetical protein n=1 Tax=Streptomyces sp. NPDC014889 TaxID=3364928 RepID=UPI0036FAF489
MDKKAKAWTRPIVDAVRLHLQDRYRLAVDLGLGLGLRQGEAFGLGEHCRRYPPTPCTLPWRAPEPPANALEARQRKPVTVRLVLTTSHGNRIYYRTWNDRSWRVKLYSARREDMFQVLRHTYASVQLEAGESLVSVSSWLGHSSSTTTLTHYAHFMPGAGQRGLAIMDTWLERDRSRIVPEKSLNIIEC